MNIKLIAALLLLASSSSAAASEQNFPSVQVTAKAQPTLEFSCDNLSAPSAAEVTEILNITDTAKVPGLRTRLVGAVSEACNAGARHIVVQRGANGGSLTWSRTSAASSSIALN